MRFVLFLLFLIFSSAAWAQTLQHEVEAGETLYSIAQLYNSTVQKIREVNNIAVHELLLPGILLHVPDRHVVQKGETLYSIAQLYGTSVNTIRKNNAVSGNTIKIGQVFIIPWGNDYLPPQPSQKSVSDTAEQVQKTPKKAHSPTKTSVAATISKPLSFNQGGVWPVSGNIEVLDGKLPGVLIQAVQGTSVQSVSAGRVVYSGPHSSFGNVVFVQSDQNYIYVYGGQESVNVAVGQVIKAGAVIGTVGLSPTKGLPALYFSVWQDDHFVNPQYAPRG